VIEAGDRVRFALSAVFVPRREDVTRAFSLGSYLEGTVIGFSDSGHTPQAFGVVEVVRTLTVVVPVDQLHRTDSTQDEP